MLLLSCPFRSSTPPARPGTGAVPGLADLSLVEGALAGGHRLQFASNKEKTHTDDFHCPEPSGTLSKGLI